LEFSNIHLVAALGFAVAVVLGAVANRTHFCTMGAVSDWVNMGQKGRMASWALAIGIAIAGAQILEMTGVVDLPSSLYRAPDLGIGAYIIGGLLFGIGMTLAGGCGQRSLVRAGWFVFKSSSHWAWISRNVISRIRVLRQLSRACSGWKAQQVCDGS